MTYGISRIQTKPVLDAKLHPTKTVIVVNPGARIIEVRQWDFSNAVPGDGRVLYAALKGWPFEHSVGKYLRSHEAQELLERIDNGRSNDDLYSYDAVTAWYEIVDGLNKLEQGYDNSTAADWLVDISMEDLGLCPQTTDEEIDYITSVLCHDALSAENTILDENDVKNYLTSLRDEN